MSRQDYWAEAHKDEIAVEIRNRFEEYQHWCETTGYYYRIKRSYDTFYSIGEKGTLQLDKAEGGKTTSIKVNHFKSLLNRLHSMITQQKLAFSPRAINSDAESQIDSDLAEGLLEFYNNEKHMGATLSQAVKTALICLESHTWAPWDRQKGKEVAADEDQKGTIYEGDQEFQVLTALAVARCVSLEDSPWKILRVKKHMHTLAAQYPKHKDEILKDSDGEDTRYDWYLDPTQSSGRGYTDVDSYEDESVYVYVLYHERNHAIPEGREVWICGDAVLEDKPLEYDKIPVYSLRAGSVIESIWSDSPSIDALPLQHAIDLLTSAVLTNNVNNAQQNIWSPDPNLKVRRLNESQNLITSATKPEGINFTESSPETYKLIESMVQQQQVLSGVNEAARGGGASSASGSSIAIQMGIALQSVSSLQANYTDLAGDIGSCVINNLKSFSQTERIAYIAGSKKKSSAKKFMAEDLENIDRIIVSVGNPMTQSAEGRWVLLEQLIKYQVITDPTVLGNFLETGEIESATEDAFADSLLIRGENQAMLKGESVPVIMTDDHPRHILKHKEMFSDPDTRSNPQLMQVVLDHISDHIQANKDLDPDLAAILNIPPLPSQQPPVGPDGKPVPPPPPGAGGPPPGAPPANLPGKAPPAMAGPTNAMIKGMGE